VGASALDAPEGSAGAVLAVTALVAVSLGAAWLRSTPPDDEAR
jgi:hypothetical protein